jgi:F-type H+-transporting ATPase subunit a
MIAKWIASPLFASHSPVDHVLPHDLHHTPWFTIKLGGADLNLPFFDIHGGEYKFFINNHMLMTLVAGIVTVLVFAVVASRVRPVGSGLQAYQTRGRFSQMMEAICGILRDQVVQPNLGKFTDKYIGYIWTIFFFILFCNVLGMVPFGSFFHLLSGERSAEGVLQHLGGTATSNLALNLMLAGCSFIAILYVGIREAGLKNFLAHFNPVGWDDRKMLPMGIGMFFLEWMGLIIKCVVLAMRLFGTMMAGHLVIAAFVALIFSAAAVSSWLGAGVGLAVLFGGIALTLLELFIAMLQAFIFTFLTVLFIGSTIGHHAHDHHDDHHGHGHDHGHDEKHHHASAAAVV